MKMRQHCDFAEHFQVEVPLIFKAETVKPPGNEFGVKRKTDTEVRHLSGSILKQNSRKQ